MKTDQPVAVSREDRSPAQFFFEIGFGACLAEAFVRNETFPFTVTDEIVERAWAIAGEAHEDPAEFDHYLRLATRDGAVERGAGKMLDMVGDAIRATAAELAGVSRDVADGLLGLAESMVESRSKMIADVARALLAEPAEGEGK